MKKMFTAIVLMAAFTYAVISCGDKKTGDSKTEEESIENLSPEELMNHFAEKADKCTTSLEFMTCFAETLEKCSTREQMEAIEDGLRLSKNYKKFDPSEIDEAAYKELRERIDKAHKKIKN